MKYFRYVHRRSRSLSFLVCVALGVGLSACSSPSSAHAPVPTWSVADRSTPVGVALATTEPPQGWTPASTGALGATVLLKTVTTSTRRSLVVAEFPAATTAFHLHVGSGDPPSASSKAPVDSDSSISATEVPALVAAFNGAFKIDAQAGGMVVDGITVSPMLATKATAVVYENGSLDVGVWGVSVPTRGRVAVNARQNLQLLVDGGQVTTAAHSTSDAVWGSSVSGAVSARSGLGVDKDGNVFYVAAMAAVPQDLAEAMVQVNVIRGMQLDMNPAWISLGVAERPGTGLSARVPGQNLSPSVFMGGWQRDFFAVLAKPNRSCRLVFPTPAGVAAPDPPVQRCSPASVRGAS